MRRPPSGAAVVASGTMSVVEVTPPPSVLDAWAVTDAQPLAGGQGEAFRAGSLVLKPAGEPVPAEWLAATLDGLAVADDLRVVRPVRSMAGRWVVDGWAAWRWLGGEHGPGRWDDVLDVSARFHRAVADVPWSSAMVASHRWAVADRVAWGELDAALPEQVQPLLERRRPVDLPRQLVHGDLGGNVLFHDVLPPAVIDVSPFWRPVGYADAVVVADAVAWGGGGDELVERLLRDQGEQLLLRALLFRVAVDDREAEAYQRVTGLLLEA
ncbi:MAG: aminoglycoside phosphotransferase [Actinomycetia bacterium]|nr:aminoglycoside phosphotransferase [Actinomycetes bacterium]